MYTTETFEASIAVTEYLERFVDIPTFLAACKACPNYGHLWSCPPYDFDVEAYWKQFHMLHLAAVKIVFDEEERQKAETKAVLDEILAAEKKKLGEKMMAEEKKYPGSVSLSAGCCDRCAACTRTEGKACRFPQEMRYSLESLGANVGLTIERLMHLKLEWMEEGRLPHYFVLVNGVLVPILSEH